MGPVPVSRASCAAVAPLPHAVVQVHGHVDLVINNAGVALGGTFEEVSEADFDWVMAVNFEGVVRMTRAFLPKLRERQQARIVNISSLFGLIAPPGHAAYCASKFAVRGFSNALRHELAGTQVGVTVVHPGGVATSIARNARTPGNLPEEEVRQGRAEFEKLLRLPPQKAAEITERAVEADRERVLVGRTLAGASDADELLAADWKSGAIAELTVHQSRTISSRWTNLARWRALVQGAGRLYRRAARDGEQSCGRWFAIMDQAGLLLAAWAGHCRGIKRFGRDSQQSEASDIAEGFWVKAVAALERSQVE